MLPISSCPYKSIEIKLIFKKKKINTIVLLNFTDNFIVGKFDGFVQNYSNSFTNVKELQ